MALYNTIDICLKYLDVQKKYLIMCLLNVIHVMKNHVKMVEHVKKQMDVYLNAFVLLDFMEIIVRIVLMHVMENHA